MKIQSLTIQNFRPFHGEQTIEFSSSDGKMVTLFQGAMGAGKTRLFGAIQWCLYGEEDYDQERPASNGDIMNSLAKREESTAETKVELVFEDDGTKYKSIRKFFCYRYKI